MSLADRMVALEAMACAKPVVCSRVEGSEELLANDLEGQGFIAGNDAQMADLAESFLHDESLANEIGTRNQEFVRSRFSIPTMVDSYRRQQAAGENKNESQSKSIVSIAALRRVLKFLHYNQQGNYLQ